MPRTARVAPAGMIHHVLNRAVARFKMFRGERDFATFERILLEAHERCPLPILSYCVMPNHWHFVTHPQTDDQLTRFFRWLTHTHAMRWRVAHQTVGFGHLYQGRFKNFPAQRDEHALTLCRYVERNALSAGLVRRAEQWRWCSLWARENGSDELKSILAPWPVERPDDWIDVVNRAISSRELDRLKLSMQRSRPYGSDAWTHRTVARLGLRHTLRSEGRPRKPKKN